MSRSGYGECYGWALICWRGAVASATKGKRGQAFFNELLVAMDKMPVRRLIAGELEASGEFCTLGVLGNSRGLDMGKIDPDEPEQVSSAFDIACALAQEVVYMNDEYGGDYLEETPEDRWMRMRNWISDQIISGSNDDRVCH